MSPTCPLCYILDHTSHYIILATSPFLSFLMSFTLCSPNRQFFFFVIILSSVFFPVFPCPVHSFIFSSVFIRKKPSCTFPWFPFISSVFDLVVLYDLESPPTNFQTCHLQYSKIATVVFHFISLYYFTFFCTILDILLLCLCNRPLE